MGSIIIFLLVLVSMTIVLATSAVDFPWRRCPPCNESPRRCPVCEHCTKQCPAPPDCDSRKPKFEMPSPGKSLFDPDY